MQFRVPQFIDIEDKILGPLTWKQFAYCLGAAGTAYVAVKLVGSNVLGLIVGSPLIGFFLALAFLKINGRSFLEILASIVRYFTGSNVYTWQKKDAPIAQNVDEKKDNKIVDITPKVKYNRDSLKNVAYGLDIGTRDDENI